MVTPPAGIEVKPDDPSRLEHALQQYVDDQKLLKRSKKTLAAHRITKESFQKSCRKTFLDQVDRRDLLNYAESLRKQGLSDRTVFTHWIAVMSILALTRIAKRAGLDDSRFWLHKSRATAATTWLRGRIDIRTVQSLLGHKDLASTMRYLKPMAGSDLHQKMNGLYAAMSAGV
jgi:site-specific recombinase XerD